MVLPFKRVWKVKILNMKYAVKLSFDHVRQCCKQTINKVFTITEKAPTKTFYWLEAPTSTFTFKLFKSRHYAKRAPKHS